MLAEKDEGGRIKAEENAANAEHETRNAGQAAEWTTAAMRETLKTWRDKIGESGLLALLELMPRAEDDPSAELPGRKPRQIARLLRDVGELPPMLIQGLLPERSLFLLAGKPKAGKSFLALDIADCVCQGKAVLGAYAVNRPGPVVYVGMEDGEFEIANRLYQRGMNAEDTRGLHYVTAQFTLSDALNMARFRADIEAIKPVLIVIDTAAEALGIRDWLNRGEIIQKVAPIRELARQVCTVLMVAHNRKAEGDLGDEIAGSNAFTGAVDGWLSAYKVEKRADGNRRLFLRMDGRGGVRGELAAEMDTNTLQFRLVPACELQEHEPEKDDVRSVIRQERHALIREAVQKLGGRATAVAIGEEIGVTYRVAWATIRDMLEAGELADTGKCAKASSGGRPSPLFCLPQEDGVLAWEG